MLGLTQVAERDHYLMFSEMKDAFDLFDKNGDQKISVSELGMVLRSLGQNPTDKEVEEIMKKADKDGMYGNFPHNCLGWGGGGGGNSEKRK